MDIPQCLVNPPSKHRNSAAQLPFCSMNNMEENLLEANRD